jgi:RNA polymerase sigma-70 factor (ECF subfamily)
LIDDGPATRASLLLRLRDPKDGEAWRQFVQVYAAVVYGFARKRGLQDADAADLMQDVFRAVASAAGRLQYDRARGTFRGWLYTVTRNKLYNFLTGRRRRERASGDSDARELLEAQAAPPDGAAEFDQGYERRAFTWAAERVRGEFTAQTWQAFWLTAVDNVGAKEVGSRLGLSTGAVYVAKSRVLARLREEIQQLQQE